MKCKKYCCNLPGSFIWLQHFRHTVIFKGVLMITVWPQSRGSAVKQLTSTINPLKGEIELCERTSTFVDRIYKMMLPMKKILWRNHPWHVDVSWKKRQWTRRERTRWLLIAGLGWGKRSVAGSKGVLTTASSTRFPASFIVRLFLLRYLTRDKQKFIAESNR